MFCDILKTTDVIKERGLVIQMEKVLFDQDTITRSLKRIAHEILEKNDNLNDVVIIGIKTRGSYLAERLVRLIEVFEGVTVPLGELDITKYRDDITREMKEVIVNQSTVPMTLNGKTVILVDDVLYTGRTVRAALEAVLEYGRPKNIQLATLIDRGHRELPIRADYVGKNIPTSQKEVVNVYLTELDKFISTLNNVKKVEVLPYHTLGVFKWEELGIPYQLDGINPPNQERIDNANKLLHTDKYR